MTRRRPFVPWIDTAVFALVFALPPALADAVVAPDRMTADDPAGRLESLTLPRPVVVGTDALLLPSAARAIAPGDDGAAPLSGFARSERRARTSRAALEAWAPGAAAQFQITTNAWTGLPHRAYGPPLAIASGALDNAAQAEDAARAWLEAHVALWAADDVPAPADLALVKSRHVGRTWFLVFQQLHRSVEVESGRVDLRLRDDGRLTLVGSDWLPGVAVDPRASRLSLGVADASARTAIGFDAAHDRYQGGTRVILPLPGPDGALEYRVAWRVMHRTENPPALWRSYVDANTGETLARENDLRYDTLVGRVTGMVHPLMPTDPLVALPLRDAVLTTTLDSVFTGADGRYSFPAISTGFVIRNALRGPFEEVVRATGGPPVQQQVSAPANDTLNFNWPIPPADSSEADAFYHVAVVRQYVKKIEPLFDALDYRVPVTVNIPALCNAFWDGVGVNFFHFGIRGDGVACANTGMIADVIYHEYGHGRTQFVWAPFAPSGPMHEGLSDYLAATITNQPVIGRGFFGPGTSIRTTQNTQVVNAVSCAGEVHCMGNAISGSVWDMRRNLIAALGDSVTAIELADSLFHFAGYGGSPWHDDYLLDLLVVDDDDGNLLNGTPHYGQICPAFSLHGIPCPAITFGVWVAHVPLGDAGLAAGPFQVDASIGSSLDPIVASSVNLQWRVQNSPWNTVVMTPLGGDDYRAFIPALPGGGRVDYYVTGADAGARVGSSPAGAPAAFHTFYVGNLSTVFADDFEIDRGWSSVVGGVTGRWMRVDPNGTPDVDDPSFFYAPEDDHTPNPAHFCFVTGDTTAGLDVGAADIDGGCQTLLSPVLDLSGRANARLSYWRWFTDETRYDDTLSVAVSPDGGTTWTELERQPFTQNQWLSRSFDVGAYIPLTNQFRFRVRTCDGGGGSLLEAGLDDFLLTTRVYGTTSAGDTPGSGDVPQVAFLGAIEPNPARGGASARIAFGVPRSAAGATARASLQIVDLRGRIVQTLIDSPLTPGMYAARWDGTDRRGARVAGGVYFVRLAVDGNRASEKIVRLD